ncbi:spindle and centriole-associated protein 1-like [Lineus longissimus]|uniref:spindle and centriole-associated protein 1-like n=1 Tax=Lineus longissimus TaxID=88925 RepID=UPI002B4D4C8B
MSFTTRSARQKFPHPSTVGVRHKKALRKKPAWDGTVNNLEDFKSSPEEIARRKEAHRSKNLEKVKGDLQDRVMARVLKNRETRSPTPNEKRQLAILKEVLHDKGEFEDVLMKSDKALAMVQDMFGDNPVRYTGFPNVTVAPAQEDSAFGYYDNLPRKPELNTSQLEQLSESVMDKNALNEEKDLFSESLPSDEELGSLNFQPRMDLNRFRELLAAEQQQAAMAAQRTPTKSDAMLHLDMHTAINDSLKVRRTKHVDKENVESNQSSGKTPPVKQMKDLRKVLGNLENEIAEFERQRGKEVPTADKQHSNTFSGYTLALVDAVTRLTHFLRESELRLQSEKTLREQLSDEVSHFRQLIDALTSELISCREDFFQLHSEFDMFKRASAEQIQQLQARVFGENFVPKPVERPLPPSNETYTARMREPMRSPHDEPPHHAAPNIATAIPAHVHNVQPAVMLSPPRQRDSNKHARELPVREEPGPQLDAKHTVNVTKPVSLIQSGSAPAMTTHGPGRTYDIASQIAELSAEHKRAQARMKHLQDLNSAFGVSTSESPESSKHSSAKVDSLSTRKDLKNEEPEITVGDTPRSCDTLQSVESLVSDKDDIRRQIMELNRQRERAQNMMEKIARQEADLMQPLEVHVTEKQDGVSPAISPILQEGSLSENQSVDSQSDSKKAKGIMIALPTVDQQGDHQPDSVGNTDQAYPADDEW